MQHFVSFDRKHDKPLFCQKTTINHCFVKNVSVRCLRACLKTIIFMIFREFSWFLDIFDMNGSVEDTVETKRSLVNHCWPPWHRWDTAGTMSTAACLVVVVPGYWVRGHRWWIRVLWPPSGYTADTMYHTGLHWACTGLHWPALDRFLRNSWNLEKITVYYGTFNTKKTAKRGWFWEVWLKWVKMC